MNDLMSNFVNKVAEVSKDTRPLLETFKLDKRTVVVRTHTGEVVVDYTPPEKEPDDVSLDARVVDSASMVEWMEKVATGPGIVAVSRKGVSIAKSGPLIGAKKVHACQREFYDDLLPPARATPQQWLEWWDKVSAGVPAETAARVNAAVVSISGASAKSLTIAQSGATLSVAVNAENGVKTAAPLPKRFIAMIPFGDPGFATEVCFSLRLSVHNDAIIFETTVDEYFEHLDPFGQYVKWACEKLEPLRAAGWTILRTR